jgi:hypothetical protein
LRNDLGRNWAVKGSKRGLFYNFPAVPAPLFIRQTWGGREPLLIVEGPTDAAAAIDLGYRVIGRPSCVGCEDMIAALVRQSGAGTTLIIADNDGPGQLGAL